MRAILRTGFGGPEQLVIREIPKPEPKDGHAVIEVKAFGINHAEMHMRKGEWAEIADVSGIECVGVVESCPGGEFAIGTKVAALMGGLGRTINGSYAEYTCAPVTNVAAIESNLPWEDLAAIPESYATAWACLFRNLEIASGQTLVVRGATSSFGQAALNMAVNSGVRVIATTRSRDRFHTLEALGASRVETEGPELSKRFAETKRVDAVLDLVGNSTILGLPGPAPSGRAGVPGWLPRRTRSGARLQPAVADAEWGAFQLLRQLRVRNAGLPLVGRAAAGDRRRCGEGPLQGEAYPRVPLRGHPRSASGHGVESGQWQVGGDPVNGLFNS
jgi:NADPH:quinone reductase